MKGSRNEKGQSLVDVVAAIALAVIVALALVGITTTSIRNARFAKNQSLATKYAQETMEKIRAKRDQDSWDNFKSSCSPTLSVLSDPFVRKPIECPCYDAGDNQKSCSDPDVVKVKATVIISWNSHEVKLVTFLTKWE